MKVDEITGGAPYGATTVAGLDGQREVSENELAGARYQGRILAEVAASRLGRRLNAVDGAMKAVEPEIDNMEPTERELLAELRRLRRSLRLHPTDECDPMEPLSVGQRVADTVAGVMGSWKFIIVQTVLFVVWVSINLVAAARSWDPFPFILLNLALSFQAAYAAPIIMMSQNRQQDIDRRAAENDYKINVKAELEIELLHEKIDELRAQEVLRLTEAVKCLTDLLLQTRQSGRADFAGAVEQENATT